MERIVVSEVEMTCGAFPSQWEGRTVDGRYVYVRYRYGQLRVSVGDTLENAILGDEAVVSLAHGHGYAGVMTYSELVRLTGDRLSWPIEIR